MDMNRLDLRTHHSGSTQSEESALDMERNCCNHSNLPWSNPSSLQPTASGGQHSESNAAYFSWPTVNRLNDTAEDRANYFGNLQKGVLPEILGRLPSGQQSSTLLELMTIRAFHSKILRRVSLGTAIGFRIRRGVLTDIPAILVFVARKVHRQWLNHVQCLPSALEGPGGVWCDVDVVEFSYFGAPAATPKEQLYTELVDGLRGGDPSVGSGSQVANQETYGTLGAIVKSRTGNRQVGFLTNRHVAVDLDYPNQKMFHPLPPSLGPGVYLGAVERATSFIADELWYGIFAGMNPGAVQDQRTASAAAMYSTVDESSPPVLVPSKEKMEECFEPLNLNVTQVEYELHETPTLPSIRPEFHVDDDGAEAAPSIEHQFIPNFTVGSLKHEKTQQLEEDPESKTLSGLKNGCDGEMCVSLQLGEPEAKRRRMQSGSSPNNKETK
ncbi:Protein NARROW LEAF 1 [Linum perenne]